MRDGWHPYRSYGLAYAFHQYLGREGYVGLFVNYRGGIGYGREFRASLAEGHGRDEMGDVAAGAAYLKDLSYVDPDAVGIWGLSYGGYATLQLLGTRPGTFAVGVNIAGLADIRRYEEWAWERKFPQPESLVPLRLGGSPWDGSARWDDASPWTHMDACEAPVYNFHGTADSYVNVEQQDIVVDRLFDLDKEFEAEYYPDEGHVFSKRAWRRTLERIERAFDRHLFT
jgi:dipeptidyl aminopeptidase/acylaminoacyl peptidase